ncbi:cyclic peptide export ABC transporter [Desulfococcaceae bacterium HSG8]|nr:cyclic peptide export ABC transporter [Desulfococcaceae bacterium HSG8]
MEKRKSLFLFGEEYGEEKLSILFLSVVSGLAGGTIVAIVNYGVRYMVPGELNYTALVFCGIAAVISVTTKDLALKKGTIVMEETLETIRNGISNQIRHAELPEIEKRDRADIYIKMTEAKIISAAGLKKINALQAVITLIFCFVNICWLSLETGIFILVFVFAVAKPLYNYYKERAREALHESADKETELLGYVNHILDGFKEIKINQQKSDDLFYNYVTPCSEITEKLKIRTGKFFLENSLAFALSFYMGIGGIIFILSALNPRDITMILITIIFFAWTYVAGVTDALTEIIKGEVALERLRELEGKLEPATDAGEYIADESQEKIPDFHEITFENIRFDYTYNNGIAVFSLGPVTFSIKAGEILFITGGNGSGKSTLMKILTGLYHPLSGVIRIDRKEVDMADHRSLFFAMFTDFHLFDGLYGIDLVEKKEIDTLLELLELDYKTEWTGDRFSNIDLSDAQKKRLALITGLLEDKPVYVLDEWAADQDPRFRKYFYEELLPQLKKSGKTIIAVSHDDSYFHLADRMLKLEDGRIIR